MNWLAKLRTHLGYDEPLLKTPDDTECREVDAMLENAKNAFKDSQMHKTEVHKVTSSLVALRTKNHFGESIQLAMMPKGNQR